MADYWIVYRDTEDHEPRQAFEMQPGPRSREFVLKSTTFPGNTGIKDIYIRWYHRQLGPDIVHLVTYTHQPLKAPEALELVERAYRFAQGRN
jgi:hypothetical protein